MNLREATAGIRRGHLPPDVFTRFREIIGSIATATPEDIINRINGSVALGQAVIYDLALTERDEMRRLRASLGDRRLTNLCVAIRQHIEQPQRCPACGQNVPYGVYSCPSCGATLAPVRSRRPEFRPTQELVREIPSGATHIAFPYKVRKNPDGSLSCDCLGYLNQTHLQDTDRGYAVCRHIATVEALPFTGFREPSEFQKAMLVSMGVTPSPTLTNDQTYFLIKDILDQQGIDFGEYTGLVRQHGKAEGLPIWTVGWEFEGGLRNSQALSHLLPAGWNIGSDVSVHVPSPYRSVEIRSPKLFGKASFSQLDMVLAACNEIGWHNTRSAGMHTHINASMTNIHQRVALAKAWRYSFRPYIQWLVTQDRRNNTYCLPLSSRDISDIETSGVPSQGRYRSLNLCAFNEHRSVEVRLHHCTADLAEVKGWTIFLLKFFEAVLVKGIAAERFEEVGREASIDAFLNLIGMNSSAVRPVQEAAAHIRERFARYTANQDLSVQTAELDDDGYIAPAVQRSPEEEFWYQVERRYTSTPRDQRPTEGNLVNNMVRRGVSRREPLSSIMGTDRMERLDTGEWLLQSETQTHRVRWDSQTDRLICSCDYYCRHEFCRYSVAVARYIQAIRQAGASLLATPYEQNPIPENLVQLINRVRNAEQQAVEPVVSEDPAAVEAAGEVQEQAATPEATAPIEAETRPEAVPQATVESTGQEVESSESYLETERARRYYENARWSIWAESGRPPLPLDVWAATGRRVRRMIPFDRALARMTEIMSSGDADPDLVLTEVPDSNPVQYYLHPSAYVSGFQRCVLRANLALLMARHVI